MSAVILIVLSARSQWSCRAAFCTFLLHYYWGLVRGYLWAVSDLIPKRMWNMVHAHKLDSLLSRGWGDSSQHGLPCSLRSRCKLHLESYTHALNKREKHTKLVYQCNSLLHWLHIVTHCYMFKRSKLNLGGDNNFAYNSMKFLPLKNFENKWRQH